MQVNEEKEGARTTCEVVVTLYYLLDFFDPCCTMVSVRIDMSLPEIRKSIELRQI